MTNDHDESECPHIHEMFSYTTMVVANNKGSAELFKWYNKVFVKQNPGANDFELEFKPGLEEGEIVLEIVAMNPMFNVEALLTLFTAYQATKNLPKTKGKNAALMN